MVAYEGSLHLWSEEQEMHRDSGLAFAQRVIQRSVGKIRKLGITWECHREKAAA